MLKDFTQGIIWTRLILFAIPLLLSSLVQQLYNTVDLIFVGNLLGTAASSAVGASSLLITCLVGFFGGMSVGAGVVVAHAFGAGEQTKLKQAVHSSVALCLVGGVLLMLAGYLLAPFYLRLVNTPQALQADAVGYLRIYVFSFVPLVTYNICSGMLRALGDSQTPLYAQLVGGIGNVLLDALLLMGFDYGIEGVAWATVFAQSLAAALILLKLARLDNSYALRLKELRFSPEPLYNIVGIGFPAGIQPCDHFIQCGGPAPHQCHQRSCHCRFYSLF